jgi:hypothetical protein
MGSCERFQHLKFTARERTALRYLLLLLLLQRLFRLLRRKMEALGIEDIFAMADTVNGI